MSRSIVICYVLALSLLAASVGLCQNPPAKSDNAAKAPASSAKEAPKAGKAAPAPDAAPAKPADAAKAEAKKILMPSKASYTWWATAASGEVLSAPTSVETDSIEVSLPQPAAAKADVYVLNEKTGNVAAVPMATLAKSAEVKLVDSDFDVVHRVTVTIKGKNDRPVKSGSVVLKDEQGGKQTVLVEPADKGVAEFKDVPAGKLDIKASSGDTSITQQSTLEATRPKAEANIEVILPGDVPTVAAETSKPAAEKPKAPSRTSPLSWIVPLIILALIAAVAAMLLKSRNVTMKGMMEKAGIPLEENQPTIAAGAPSSVAPPLDPDQVGPAPGAPTAPPPASGPSLVGGPRLIGLGGTYNAAVFPIAGNNASIGRDPGMDIALVDDNTASRRHARVTCAGGVCTIIDEGSSNGTYVNGKKVAEQVLGSGDEVQIGSTRFRFEC